MGQQDWFKFQQGELEFADLVGQGLGSLYCLSLGCDSQNSATGGHNLARLIEASAAVEYLEEQACPDKVYSFGVDMRDKQRDLTEGLVHLFDVNSETSLCSPNIKVPIQGGPQRPILSACLSCLVIAAIVWPGLMN